MKSLAFSLVLLALPHAPRAQTVDYAFLVGTWSEPGQCEALSERSLTLSHRGGEENPEEDEAPITWVRCPLQ